MTTVQTDEYSLRRAPEEYERLRAQARMWEAATGRLLDRIGLAPGVSCLDAGCGPGEVMRLMAHRVGPEGRVTGIDVDASLAATTQETLATAGHRQCRVLNHDLTSAEALPGGPYDLVFARLLLFHLPQRIAVLRRLWAAVAPGGHLLLQDYDLAPAGVVPTLASAEEIIRVINGAFRSAGCDVRTGARLPRLMARAGVGEPDGTDVAGQIDPLRTGRRMLEATYRSVLPGALAAGITTSHFANATMAALDRDATRYPDRPVLWPLMVGAWKRKAEL
jgi:2-polyprenyl-3-methyl-5-hydroxy-6-metoxy-1,4-benzoquinol methylase